jgi:molybdopterin-binding protein
VVTRKSAENLGLKEGDTITVVIKATEVLLARE